VQIYFSMTGARGKPIVAPIKAAKTGTCINKCAIFKEPKVLALAEPGPGGTGYDKRVALLEFSKSIGCKCCDYQVFLNDGAKCSSACDGTKKMAVTKKAKKGKDPNAKKKPKSTVPKKLQQKPSTKKTKVVKGSAPAKKSKALSPAERAQQIEAIKNTKPGTVNHLTGIKDSDHESLRKDFGHKGGVRRADQAAQKARQQQDAQVHNTKDPDTGKMTVTTKGGKAKAPPGAAKAAPPKAAPK